MSLSVDGLAVGDIVRVQTTRTVSKVTDTYVALDDVQNGSTVWFSKGRARAGRYGTARVDMVKRASRPCKPKQGDVLAGREIRDRQWKRDTIIHVVGSTQTGLVLTSDAHWRSLDNGELFEFDDLASFGQFKLVYVA